MTKDHASILWHTMRDKDCNKGMRVKIMNVRVLYKAQKDRAEQAVKVLRWQQALKDLVVSLA